MTSFIPTMAAELIRQDVNARLSGWCMRLEAITLFANVSSFTTMRIYDTFDPVSWATNYLLENLSHKIRRYDVIRRQYASGERVSNLARESFYRFHARSTQKL